MIDLEIQILMAFIAVVYLASFSFVFWCFCKFAIDENEFNWVAKIFAVTFALLWPCLLLAFGIAGLVLSIVKWVRK